mgnify:CR=1 FL=1
MVKEGADAKGQPQSAQKRPKKRLRFFGFFGIIKVMKNLKIQQDYSKYPRNYQLRICGETDVLIPRDDSVRLLSEVMEELDYTNLYRAYSRKGRKPKTSPVTMFKIPVYGAMDGNHSGRELERACRRDINYMWLLGDEEAPSHDALTRFRSGPMAQAIEDLFYQLVKKLHELGEIEFAHLFVDGTKIEANANKYSFVWKKSVGKYQSRLEKNLLKHLEELTARYGWLCPEISAKEAYDRLSAMKSEPFVHGRGKRKSQLQQDMELLSDMMAR